jgi:protein-disulfide isomerase
VKKRIFQFTALATAVLASSMAMSAQQAAATVSDPQKKEIEKIIHDYLVNNPEVLLEASQALQVKQQHTMEEQAKAAIQTNAKDLFQGDLTTVGNPQGKVTLVEFFDYQCIHCKKMAPVVDNLVKNNKDLRVIYMEFPIFGKASEFASQAALAAAKQGKYLAMHQALIQTEKHLENPLVLSLAKSLGLDMTQLEKDMNSKEVKQILDANRQLAEKLHLMGTPAFIIASTPVKGELKKGSQPAFIPGAASEESMTDLIKKASQ